MESTSGNSNGKTEAETPPSGPSEDEDFISVEQLKTMAFVELVAIANQVGVDTEGVEEQTLRDTLISMCD